MMGHAFYFLAFKSDTVMLSMILFSTNQTLNIKIIFLCSLCTKKLTSQPLGTRFGLSCTSTKFPYFTSTMWKWWDTGCLSMRSSMPCRMPRRKWIDKVVWQMVWCCVVLVIEVGIRYTLGTKQSPWNISIFFKTCIMCQTPSCWKLAFRIPEFVS